MSKNIDHEQQEQELYQQIRNLSVVHNTVGYRVWKSRMKKLGMIVSDADYILHGYKTENYTSIVKIKEI